MTHAEADEEGKGLWVASLNGLLYYDWKQRAFTRYYALSESLCQQGQWTPQASAVRHFVIKGDSAWLATYGGLLAVDLRSGAFAVHRPNGTPMTSCPPICDQ